MTGPQALLIAGRSNGVVNPLPMVDVTSSPGGGGDTTWTFELATNGTLVFRVSDNGGSANIVSANWYFPTTTNVGSGYWARVTVTAGTSPNTGTTGSWITLGTASKEWAWVRTTVGTTTATITIEIATDSGGSTVVASITGIDLSLEKGS